MQHVQAYLSTINKLLRIYVNWCMQALYIDIIDSLNAQRVDFKKNLYTLLVWIELDF